MRIDKFLKNSRIIKRRTLAKEACEKGKVLLNNKEAKPGTEVSAGDILQINFGAKELKIEILELLEHVTKEDACKMYKILE
ncbi:RNA-binding S4 domain-containing protein [Clostridiaceae bacterium M8S5]|nr:RNA-binding S4 domain-containing protein [Clostridiaceae bacterium M8S5]